jgi:Transposase DDE domain group 1
LVNSTARLQTVEVTADGEGLVSHAGAALLVELADRAGLTGGLSEAMAPPLERRSSHDPGRVLRDVAVMLADGGDCVTDMAAYEGQERLFGAKASETTTQRVLKSVDERLLERICAARAAARARVWDAGARPETITLNIDATLVTAHSEKDRAAGAYKHGYGFHPICCYLDETGEPLAAILRPGNAGSNTAADHFAVLALALEQLPAQDLDREILVRADSGGATHAFTADCRDAGIRFSVGYELNDTVRQAILELPETAWTQAIDADRSDRDGAWVAEPSDRVDLSAWPEGSRLICRRERPHPGAQFEIFDEHATAIRAFSPTRTAPTSPRWSCATAGATASRTASAPARRPGCATCPTTPSSTTRPGWSSRSSPKTCSAG